MANNSTRKMFLNLAVREVKRSIAFFTNLGFTFPEFTDDEATCMVVNPDACVMLLSEPIFKMFTKREICNTDSHNRASHRPGLHQPRRSRRLGGPSCPGGRKPGDDAVDRWFMYAWSFYDLDGHLGNCSG